MNFTEKDFDKVIELPPQTGATMHAEVTTDDLGDFIASLEAKAEAELTQPFRHAGPLIVEANLSAWQQRKIIRGAFDAGAIAFPTGIAEQSNLPEPK